MQEGDINSRYYHISTIVNRRANAIEHIKNNFGHWISEKKLIADAFITFYSDLFSSSDPCFPTVLCELIPNLIIKHDNSALCVIPEIVEVRDTLFSMNSHKSLGPDSFNLFFLSITGL